MIDPAKYKPNANFVLLLKCTNEHIMDDAGKVLIALTDQTLDHTNWLEVVDVGPKCEMIQREHIGALVQCPNFHHELMNMRSSLGDGYWLCREKDRSGQPVIKPFVYWA